MKNLCLAIAVVCFAVFAANVLTGASDGQVFLTDIQEMLALFGACVFFVAAILMIEKRVLLTQNQKNDITGRR